MNARGVFGPGGQCAGASAVTSTGTARRLADKTVRGLRLGDPAASGSLRSGSAGGGAGASESCARSCKFAATVVSRCARSHSHRDSCARRACSARGGGSRAWYLQNTFLVSWRGRRSASLSRRASRSIFPPRPARASPRDTRVLRDGRAPPLRAAPPVWKSNFGRCAVIVLCHRRDACSMALLANPRSSTEPGRPRQEVRRLVDFHAGRHVALSSSRARACSTSCPR